MCSLQPQQPACLPACLWARQRSNPPHPLPLLQAKPSYAVKPGDVVAASLLPPPPLEAAPEALPLEVVYEDEHLLVINKVGRACFWQVVFFVCVWSSTGLKLGTCW